MASPLEVRLLGPLEVARGQDVVPLPQSKKTRALLGYLIATGRAHSRERLCDLLWDVAEDRRGALRWSLSQLRKLLDDDASRIVAAGDQVSFDTADCTVDTHVARDVLRGALDDCDRLDDAVRRFRGPFLEGEDQPDFFEYQAWLLAERESWRATHARLLQALIQHLEPVPDQALEHARAWVNIAQADPGAWSAVVRVLARLGRQAEAEQHYKYGLDALTQDTARQLQATWRSIVAPTPTPTARRSTPAIQRVQFCTAPDGVRIAYASVGSGPPLVKTANWMNHLEYDWKSPFWRHVADELSDSYTLVRYDQRGNGLSDWNVDEFSLEAFVSDFETVVDACGLERFPVFGISQGCAVAIEYAARHPERITRLVLHGGYPRGWLHRTEPEQVQRRALLTLIREGWGNDNPAFRQMFSLLFMPEADADTLQLFNELQLVSCSPDNAARINEANAALDVSDRLGQVQCPTLILHCNRDARIPFDMGREIAAGIPGSRFVALDSPNHLLLQTEPAWQRFLDEVRAFLAEDDSAD